MNILIIEKYKLYQECLIELISSNFDTNIIAYDSDDMGAEFIQSELSNAGHIDIVFLNVKVDDILSSAPLLLANRYKKAINPNMTIILFSMEMKCDLINDVLEIGYIDYFITKSISKKELVNIISLIQNPKGIK